MLSGIPRACIRAAMVAALAAGGQVLAAENASLVVYNAQHESLTKAWVEGFTKETGIQVTVRNGDDTELANQIIQEGSASPADVFLTENSPAMVLVDSAEMFAPLWPETREHVAAPYRPANAHWVGIAARSTVFVYNPKKVSDAALPGSIMDLAQPAWKGRWGASPAGGDFQAIVAGMLELKGEAATLGWLKAMKANATMFRGNSAVLKAVNAGQIDSGVIYHYYLFVDQAKTGENSNNVSVQYFRNQDPGAFISISGGGVLKTSHHADEAQAFLKWVTGKGGQAVLREGNSFEYAVGENASSNTALVPLKELNAPSLDASRLDSKKVVALMTEAGLL